MNSSTFSQAAKENLSVATALSATIQNAFSTVSMKLEASAAQHATTQQAQNVCLEALAASLQVREGWEGGVDEIRYGAV